MRNKIAFLSASGLVVIFAIILAGCGTDKPWTPNPNRPLTLSIVSGPTDSLEVAMGSTVTYTWTYIGGKGVVQYQYKVDSGNWSALSTVTFAVLENLALGYHDVSIRAQDEEGATSEVAAVFRVAQDTSIPFVSITESPAEGSFVATGGTISFSWTGYDSSGSGDNLTFSYAFAGDTSAWLPTRTVTFASVVAADPATFTVWAKDLGNNISPSASVSFIVKNASILYVDDYQWLDPFQNVDRVKEREQKAFYRSALQGFAFAEWEVATQGMPDSSYITTFSTVLFASDSYLGDASDTWWTQVGDAGGGVLRYYMQNGGHLLATGSNILQWIYNTNPPHAGDFEYDWFGLDSTGGWDYWDDFTWAVNPGNFAGLPDSMKIDVAKNGDQVDIAENIFGFRAGVTTLFVKGLDIDGGEPHDYGVSVGHIFYPNGGAARSALIDFDTFSMPLPGIRETFHLILSEFGEVPTL